MRWRNLHVDGVTPHLKVRRAIVMKRVEPPKTRHGTRQVPLAPDLVAKLWARRAETEWPDADDLVFVSMTGTPLGPRQPESQDPEADG